MSHPTTAELIFSEQANHNFSKTLSDIKRQTLSIHNRLRSILDDAAFVQQVASAYGRPLIANERCGSWYIDPVHNSGSAYFKSTDGHTGVWAFSTRRLNLQLLEWIGRSDGCIIVDSTRRGKRMPDALSKTIPIWCAVLNRALFPENAKHHDLHTPPQAVSSSENAQITSRLDSFVQSFLALGIDVAAMRAKIHKPLRPAWITPDSHISPTDVVFEEYHPVVCCTASRRVVGGEVSEGGYIQGSGDDTENWAHGLTPSVFWAHKDLLLSTPAVDLPQLIAHLIAQPSMPLLPQFYTDLATIPPTTNLHITTLSTLAALPPDPSRISILLHPSNTPIEDANTASNELHIPLGPHKLGSRKLPTILPSIITFITSKAALSPPAPISTPPSPTTPPPPSSTPPSTPQIILACTTAKDHSIGTALTLLCLLYDNDGRFCPPRSPQLPSDSTNPLRVWELGGAAKIDKRFIRRRLGWIMTAMPDVQPSGATLQAVNGFLMRRPG